jgi:succinate dehydrogenase/fumarate reductase flavoprotein subunit
MSEETSKLSRRSFLKGATVSTLAVVGAAALAGCASTSDGGTGSGGGTTTYTWDKEADFVVAGGGTGMGGAVSAAVNGMSVILVEARDALGGAMALSGGCAWLPNTSYSQANGDNREKALTYLNHVAMEIPNEGLIEAFVDNAQNALDDLLAGGIDLQPYYPIEYHPDWEGAQNEGGRSCLVPKEDGTMTTGGGGGRLGLELSAAMEALGVEVMLETTAYKLVSRRESADSAPEVLGLICKDSEGKEIRIKANKGVLLATGGFEWDETLKANYLRTPSHYMVSYSTNNGATLRMAQAMGADLRLMKETFGQAVYTVHGEYGKELGIPCPIVLQTERAFPGSIIVDQNGRRFCNEASDYDSQSNTFGGYNNFGPNGFSADPAWYVFDNTCYEAYKPGTGGGFAQFDGAIPDIPEDELYIVADTLDELADKIGVNKEFFLRQVEEWNYYAKDGTDPLFSRDTTRPLSGVTETMGLIEAPPYRAISVSNGCLGTIGGPRLNENAMAVHVEGDPIKRLYACGNCAGVGAPGPAYGGAGGTIGPAFVFGAIAAHHAVAQEPWT